MYGKLKSKKLNVGNVVVNIIFYPVLVLMISLTIMMFLGVRPYITMSGSMEPVVKTGSVCFVATKTEYENIRVGDIIAYEKPDGGLVIHRVVAITENGMETKGDANDVSDGISTWEYNFRGKNLFSIPYLGYLVKTLQKPQVFSVFIVLVIGFIAYMIVDAIDNRVRGKYERPKESKRRQSRGSKNTVESDRSGSNVNI